MRRKTAILTLTATVASLAAATASALDFKALDTSTLTDLGGVTEAELNQLAALSWGTYQSATVTSDLVAGGAGFNPMVWTYNPSTNQLRHQSGSGTIPTSANISTCVSCRVQRS